MKYLPLLALCIFALAGCEQDLLIQKEIIRDTVYLEKEKFIDRVFVETDTVVIAVPIEVPVPTRTQIDSVVIVEHDTVHITVTRVDTVYQKQIVYVDRVDSVFTETIVYRTDTIAMREVSYGDTLYIYGGRGVYQVYPELQPMVTNFYQEAQARGYAPNGGLLIIYWGDIDTVLQAYSYENGSQIIILNSNLTTDQAYIPIVREMARWQLNKEYRKELDHPLNPFFEGIQQVRWSNRAEHKAVIDQIFK